MSEKRIIDNAQLGTLQRIIAILVEAFETLQAHPSGETVEQLAILIHHAMTTPARHYHTPEHVFKFLDPAQPIQNLTALFHDIVYYQIDQGFAPEIWDTLAPYLIEDTGTLALVETLPSDDPLLWFALELFDLKPGQAITAAPTLNEFLSALVMIKKLAGLVPDKDLFRMIICIETTIPFRGPVGGVNYIDLLESRLKALSAQGRLPLSTPEIEATLEWAVAFSNTDIDSFAENDPGKFLDGTWKLLPESNAALRSRETYSLRDYRRAIQKMEGFISFLNPDYVFDCYHQTPPPEVFAAMTARARQNILIARDYLRLKWLAMAVLEALAEATGGDAPVSLFMGDIPKDGEKTLGLEDLLPEVPLPAWVNTESAMYQLLAVGRVSSTSFDIKNSPLSLFLYKSLPPDSLAPLLALAREMFAGRVTAQVFLAQMDHTVVTAVAHACAAMVYTRRDKLLQLVN